MSTLSLNLVPGALPADGDLIDNATLRAIARPTITLEGEIGAASITDGAVTTAKLAVGALSADTTGRAKMADAFVTAAKLASSLDLSGKTITGNPSLTLTGTVDLSGATFTPPNGYQVQFASSSTTALSTLTSAGVGTGDLSAATSGAFPNDDTIPQNNEGAELTSLNTSITPKSATNKLIIEVEVPYYSLASGTVHELALFVGSTADALQTVTDSVGTNSSRSTLRLRHVMTAGVTTALTFKARLSTNSTLTINGDNGARKYGGSQIARMTIQEIAA